MFFLAVFRVFLLVLYKGQHWCLHPTPDLLALKPLYVVSFQCLQYVSPTPMDTTCMSIANVPAYEYTKQSEITSSSNLCWVFIQLVGIFAHMAAFVLWACNISLFHDPGHQNFIGSVSMSRNCRQFHFNLVFTRFH